MITIQINHEPKSVELTTSLDVLLNDLSISLQGIAVAVNNHVITKSDWNTTFFKESDNVTIIQATQGG